MMKITKVLTGLILLAGFQSAIGDQQSEMAPPNIIILFADDISPREILPQMDLYETEYNAPN